MPVTHKAEVNVEVVSRTIVGGIVRQRRQFVGNNLESARAEAEKAGFFARRYVVIGNETVEFWSRGLENVYR